MGEMELNKLIVGVAMTFLLAVQPAQAAGGEKSAAPGWISDMGKPVCKADPAWHFSASESCEVQSGKVGESQRQCFLSACLEKMSSPEMVRQKTEQKRRATCEQNAKNMALSGSKRDGYVKDCLSRNEASEASRADVANNRKTAASAETPEWIKNATKTECVKGKTWNFSSTGDCETQAQHVKVAERHCFIAACLDRKSSPEHVRQKAEAKKRATCEQNAKNMTLSGARHDGYISDCMHKNEAARAAGIAPAETKIEASESSGKQRAGKGSKRDDKCYAKADEKGLKGKERKQFVARCGKK